MSECARAHPFGILKRMPKKRHPIPPRLGLLPRQPKPVPHEFVLEALGSVSFYTRPMFGCLAIYVAEKIVLILRDKPNHVSDNGVWLATTQEHHASLRKDFPNLRSIAVLGKGVTGWQILPSDAPDFEQAAMRACELVVAGDPRIGKVPGRRRKGMASRSEAPNSHRRR
jgi:hypothetical protein